ncbi:ATP-binding domain-containing protein [Methyloligella solikamskensis]|uniref:DNA 3'-5' helicase II n=1 Tax=Methyloligella solikamskensis TaxID=1177756 RepID=A0ABW3J831_9HYPH
MTVVAFEGPAGSGKTHRLMDELGEVIGRDPLADHQRVIALTFMHGSRRRLDARLRGLDALNRRFQAVTLDSFAWRLTQRWRRLAAYHGHDIPAAGQYGATCTLAAALLQNDSVRQWVAQSYPVVVIDEAQDFSHERSEIIRGLTQSGNVLLAFDEFQCLNTALLPIPIEGWLRNHCEPVTLEGCRRTDDAELIAAANAVRDGAALERNGNRFKIVATPGHINHVATWIANGIRWRGDGGNVALLTPSRQGGFADNAVARVGQRPVGNHNSGPFGIRWESSDDEDKAAIWGALGIAGNCTVDEAVATLAPHRTEPAVNSLRDWILRQRSMKGIDEIAADDLRRELGRLLSLRRRHGYLNEPQFAAMTIQQAKNREFDHVIVLWPYTVPNDDNQRRRLLYNAITRARRSCTVLVQGPNLLNGPPFTAAGQPQ